MISSLICDT